MRALRTITGPGPCVAGSLSAADWIDASGAFISSPLTAVQRRFRCQSSGSPGPHVGPL